MRPPLTPLDAMLASHAPAWIWPALAVAGIAVSAAAILLLLVHSERTRIAPGCRWRWLGYAARAGYAAVLLGLLNFALAMTQGWPPPPALAVLFAALAISLAISATVAVRKERAADAPRSPHREDASRPIAPG